MNTVVQQEKKWLLDEKYNGKPTKNYQQECLLLEAGVPVAYLIGHIPFLGSHIDLSYKPLIPRPETEYWVDLFIKHQSDLRGPLEYCEVELPNVEILDLFAGSGCIGIGCLKDIFEAAVDFGEINPNNIKQIKKNLKINNLNGKHVRVFESDVFSHIPEKQYDYILANPPYISQEKKDTVQDSVLGNEDHHALFADNNGLLFVYQLIDHGFNYLKQGGEMWIEFDPWQTDLIDKYLTDNKHWSHSYLKDQYNKDRVLILTKN